MLRTLLLVKVLLLISLISSQSANAQSLALLVGVSNYDETIGLSDLRGPANDVRLLRDVLQTRGDFDIRVLADGVENADVPTRQAIINELDRLVADAQPDSFIYIHFSGHGTQQADRGGDESDGKDEVFLPADTMRAEPGTSTIPNAIVDEEIGARVAAMRAKGADVWFVLDSCHSGSGLRAGSPRVANRYVEPSALGLSLPQASESAQTSVVEGPGDDDLPGGYLAFYSAQSSEVAREIQIDENEANSWYGLFTSRLAARLQSDANLTYRQLFQAVLVDLNDGIVPGAARLQTPLWEGNLIDAPVFGSRDVIGIRQFAVDGAKLSAGKLHGLRDNTIVALVSDAAAPADEVLGLAQVERSEAFASSLAAVGEDCAASVDEACVRRGNLPEDAKFARVVAKPLDIATTITPPTDLTTGELAPQDHALYVALRTAIEKSNSESGTNIQLLEDGKTLAGIHQGSLWFGPKITVGETPVGLEWRPSDGPLEPLLQRIASAEETAELLGSVASTPSLLFPSPVDIISELQSSRASALANEAPPDLFSECAVARQDAVLKTEMNLGEAIKQCDVLRFGAIGMVQGPARDVNRVYIDSQFCVHADFQRVEGVAQPALVGAPMEFCSDCPTAEGKIAFSAGTERLFFVITDAGPNQEALNLEGQLENCGAAVGASGTRSANSQVKDFLGGLSKRNATRGTMQSFGVTNIWVERFDLQLLPRKEALSQAGQLARN
ncbi:MAG: caspase family protein [Pseudomonadota bacterium]